MEHDFHNEQDEEIVSKYASANVRFPRSISFGTIETWRDGEYTDNFVHQLRKYGFDLVRGKSYMYNTEDCIEKTIQQDESYNHMYKYTNGTLGNHEKNGYSNGHVAVITTEPLYKYEEDVKSTDSYVTTTGRPPGLMLKLLARDDFLIGVLVSIFCNPILGPLALLCSFSSYQLEKRGFKKLSAISRVVSEWVSLIAFLIVLGIITGAAMYGFTYMTEMDKNELNKINQYNDL